MKKLRIGMIGAGNIANTHIQAYKSCENAEVVAMCDIDAQRMQKTAERFGITKTYSSVTEMLQNETLDAADVCVWNCNHAKCAIEALNAGLHVLCEKPMAYSTKEAEEMLEVAKKNNKLLMIGFVMRFSNECMVAKDFIESGSIGEIYHSKATYLRRHGAPGGWFCNSALSGGGPVIDLGVHVIDFARYLMGNPKPVSVYATTSDKLKNRPYLKTDVAWKPLNASEDDIYDVEDFGTAIIRYENGATTLLETSYSLNGEEKTVRELFGTRGGIKIDDKIQLYLEMNDLLCDVTPNIANYKLGTDLFANEMAHFVDCALNGTPCNASAEDGITIMRILDAIYESARTGHEVIL